MTTATIQYDLPDLLQKAGALPPRHGRGKWTCPECGRNDLSVSEDKQVFHCFHAGCSFSGGIGSLRMRLGTLRQWLHRDEYLHLRREREAANEAERNKEARKHAEARRLAESIWAKARPAPETHPYLMRKRAMPHGLRLSCANLVIPIPDSDGIHRKWQFISAGSLVIPVRDVDGTLHSLQFITSAGDKPFLSGGRVAGCCYGLGLLDKSLYLAEGFATGATIFEATGEAVAVCFFCGNLCHVAEALRSKYHKAQLIICGDNDRDKPDNPGLTAAKATARRFGVRAVWPVFAEGERGSDFNDLAALIGIQGVREQLCAALTR